MKKYYEVVGKNQDEDWETIKSDIKTLQQARQIATKEIKNKKWITIDINLIVDDDLTETYDENGKIR